MKFLGCFGKVFRPLPPHPEGVDHRVRGIGRVPPPGIKVISHVDDGFRMFIGLKPGRLKADSLLPQSTGRGGPAAWPGPG